MPNGQGLPSGTPGLPTYQYKTPTNLDVSATNIFDLIRQAYSQIPSMTSALPYAQAQLGQQGEIIKPMLESVRRGGEQQAASAQSMMGARGLRGSDIEAAAVTGARQAAQTQIDQIAAGVAQQAAQTMASNIMQSYGYDIAQNRNLYINLAQAIGQELSFTREYDMFKDQLAQYEAASKRQTGTGILGSLIGAIPGIGNLFKK